MRAGWYLRIYSPHSRAAVVGYGGREAISAVRYGSDVCVFVRHFRQPVFYRVKTISVQDFQSHLDGIVALLMKVLQLAASEGVTLTNYGGTNAENFVNSTIFWFHYVSRCIVNSTNISNRILVCALFNHVNCDLGLGSLKRNGRQDDEFSITGCIGSCLIIMIIMLRCNQPRVTNSQRDNLSLFMSGNVPLPG